jgi:hypothetical protein
LALLHEKYLALAEVQQFKMCVCMAITNLVFENHFFICYAAEETGSVSMLFYCVPLALIN